MLYTVTFTTNRGITSYLLIPREAWLSLRFILEASGEITRYVCEGKESLRDVSQVVDAWERRV